MAAQKYVQSPLIVEPDSLEVPPPLEVVHSTSDNHPRSTSFSTHIHIERLIIHGLDHVAKNKDLVDVVADLTDDDREFFAGHIATGNEKSEWDAHFADPSGEVPSWCKLLLGTEEEFIAASRALANHLYGVMTTRRISRGDLVAIVYTEGDDPVHRIALLKLDLDRRHVRDFDHSGKKTKVDIKVAHNILPEHRKLAKCALICPTGNLDNDETTIEKFAIKLLDNQAGPRTQEVATFFYKAFLRAVLLPNSKRRTREFAKACEDWIGKHSNEVSSDDFQSFWRAARSAMDSSVIDISSFVPDALPNHEELHEEFREKLISAVVSPSVVSENVKFGFHVNKTVARPIVQRVIYEIDGGIQIIGPADLIEQIVHIEQQSFDKKHRIVIETVTLKEVTQR